MSVLTATQVSVNLSVNVITQDDNGLQFAVLPLLSLSWLVMAVWQCRRIVNHVRFELAMIADEIKQRLTVAGKLLTIGFNSLAWGML